MTVTSKDPSQRLVFYALVLIASYLAYLVLSPFLVALTWAVLFAILFQPVQVALAARSGPNRAALATTLLAGLAIVTPAVMLVSAVAREAPQVAEYLQRTSDSVPSRIDQVWEVVRARIPLDLPEDPMQLIADGARRAVAFLAPRAGAVVADVFATLGALVVMLFALFFMLRDGDDMAREVRDLLPLPDDECDRLMRETRDLVVASVGAGLLVAAAQGAIGGVAFWLLRLERPHSGAW
jgi:predicted PurR-regulated permease PerM